MASQAELRRTTALHIFQRESVIALQAAEVVSGAVVTVSLRHEFGG